MRVVGCFLEYKGKFVIIHRADNKPEGGTWGLPSGKVEVGESDEQAILRELYEETGYQANTSELELLNEHEFINSQNKPYTYITYRVKPQHAPKITLEAAAHSEFAWVTPAACFARGDLILGLYELLVPVGYIDPSKLELIPPTNASLNGIAAAVTEEEINAPFLQAIIDRMLATAAGKGHSAKDTRQMVGLAAPQIGASKRIITIDVTADGSNKSQTLQVVINPVISQVSPETVLGREGCWSCGDICGAVERARQVTLSGLDCKGKPIKLELKDFVARIAQHEVDHLSGIRFPDRIPADKPERLHWVTPTEFEKYRTEWMHWPTLCPRDRWEVMKAGQFAPTDK